MLKVTCGRNEIGVWFYYKVLEPFELEGLTGVLFDKDRRCSIVQVAINNKYHRQGISICHPNDNFSRATGRKKALSDALYSLPKEMRTAVWEEYKIRCGF